MTVVAYNVFMVAMLAVALTVLGWYLRRHSTNPGRDGLLIAALTGVLAVSGLLGAVFYHGSLFGAAQLLAWGAFLHAPVFLVGIGLLYRSRRPPLATGAFALALCLGLVALDAFLIEPHWLDTTMVEIRSPKLSEPVRVVVLADIQTDRPGRYEARVLWEAMAQAPDLILLAGDYIHLGRRSGSYEEEMAALRDLLVAADLQAPLGIYAIAGNVDRPGLWTEIFAGLPVMTTEETTRYDLGPLVLTSLSMADAFGTSVALPPEERYHIVLGHSPNFSLAPVGGDLLVAGHTHGGQVQLPFLGPLLTLSVVPRGWASGVTEIGWDRWLVVSRGIGMERGAAPRVRFLCRPELVIVDLIPG
ncbi:MAG: metallophosphoesterase [Anaerolineae bacterium]|nr:metallophosphoesterase [Anaerolineae bacterium]